MVSTIVIVESVHTIETAAAVLKCNERVLREKLKSGEINGTKKLGKWYILHSTLIDYISVSDESSFDDTE